MKPTKWTHLNPHYILIEAKQVGVSLPYDITNEAHQVDVSLPYYITLKPIKWTYLVMRTIKGVYLNPYMIFNEAQQVGVSLPYYIINEAHQVDVSTFG